MKFSITRSRLLEALQTVQNGIRYVVNGTVTELYEKDGRCAVKFSLSMSDLEQNGSVVYSHDYAEPVPGPYAGSITFAQAVAIGVAKFASALR